MIMYNFKEVEEQVLKYWKDKKIYEKVKSKNKGGKKFYFLQGPPYTSGRLHIGHAWNNALKDIILRYKRMRGFNVWDRAGYDMHGLPTENAVQKKLGIKDKLGIEDYGVERFIKECIKFSSENAKLMDKDLERLGVWMDFENAYWPIKKEFIEGEWWLIKKAWEQKRLYKGKKIMHWCASCETSLAKHELEYKSLKDNSIFLKFRAKDGRYLIIWTTTPWTIPFNLAIMVNPDVDYAEVEINEEKWIIAKDLVKEVTELAGEKYKIIKTFKGKKLEGLEYEHPFNQEIDYNNLKKKWPNVHTVILSKEYVNTESGSGLVHSAPGCGPEDYEVCKKYGIDAFNKINEKGVFEDMGKFTGWVAKKDDKKFVEELDKKGVLIAQTPVEHEYATCWRCHNPVVFRATEQWFMKIEDLIPKLLEFNKKVKWQPKFASRNYDLWIENLKDNGITRQRYWGCPIPVWQCECGNIEVIGSIKELEKKGGKAPKDLHKPWIDKVKLKCKCGKEMRRVPDVIDVWVDSGTASWNCLSYPKTERYFDFWPADFILEATEQIRLWFSLLQMCSAIAFKKSCYKNVYCHGMILDYQGMKMSKSLGNIISPYEVVEKYGADVLRYYMCQTSAGENINFNWEDVKIKQRNLNVLYNISKFLIDLKKQTKPLKINLDIEERYILSKKNSTIKKVTELIEEYRIDEIIKEIENLFLDLSRVYIKLTRDKANSKNSGKVLYVVEDVYLDVLKMFSIICPFITDYIYQNFSKDSVHLSSWPKADEKKIDVKLEKEFDYALKIIEAGFAERDKVQIGLKWPLAKAVVSCDKKLDKNILEIVKNQLNVKKIELKSGENIGVELDTVLTPELEAEGYAREMSRQVQAFRKKLGLEKKDKIELVIVTDDKFKEILEKQKNFIIQRTNSKKLKIVTTDKERFKNKTYFKIKDKKGTINISKV